MSGMLKALGRLPRRSIWFVGRRGVGRGVILLYHRIAQNEYDPWELNVSPELFADQMQALARLGDLIPLAEAVRSLHDRKTPDRFVSVTFDDGYADNLTVAKPILAQLGIPATLFVPTAYMDSGQELWWDRLQRLALEPAAFERVIELEIAGVRHRWNLGEAARCDAESAMRDREWTVYRPAPTPRHVLCAQLHSLLLPLPHAEKHAVLDALAKQRVPNGGEKIRYRPMSGDEVRRFAESGMFDVGAHSETHPVLAQLSAAEQRREALQSRTRLEELLGHPVTMFAYPFGGSGSYTATTKRIVIEARYEGACVNRRGTVRNGVDRFELPRFQAKNWTGREFARRLRGWLRG